MTDDDFRTLALGLPETSVPIPKFACACGGLRRTSESIRTLGKYKFLVCFLDLKFATAYDPEWGELQIQHTSEGEHSGLPTFLVAACPDAIRRAPGSWGQRGHTHLDLAEADDATIASVLRMAWRRAAPARLAKMLGD